MEVIMRSINILKKGLATAFGAAVLFTGAAMAQDSPRDEYEEWQSARREMLNEQREYQRNPSRDNYRGWQEAISDERREYMEYQRALNRYGRSWNPNMNDGYYNRNDGYYNRNVVVNNQRRGMYRIYTNGQYYNVDNRGYGILREAVNRGYQRGYQAGINDRRYGRYNYNSNNVYMNGTFGYNSGVARNQYQYYFQQGFQRGYQDGFYTRTQYGYRSGSSINILGSVLNTILNVAGAVNNDDDYDDYR